MEINSVSAFVDAIKNVGTQPNTENYFRGHADFCYELLPSVYREGRIEFEDRLFKEMILRVPQEFTGHRAAIEYLVKMQHYGLPTRLLDITSNPLVALYFACCQLKGEKDGEVIFLQIPKDHIKFFDSDTVTFLANIARQRPDFHPDFSSLVKSVFNDQTPLHYLHHCTKDEKPHYQAIIDPKHMMDVFAVKVKLNNSRILKQNGAFLIFGICSSKSEPAQVNLAWQIRKTLGDHYIVPKDCKKGILMELDLLGINQSSLFPEIDFQASYLVECLKSSTGPFFI